MLVIAHQETRLDSAETLVPGNDVGRNLLVRGAQVRATVHVIDGCGEKEAHESGAAAIQPGCERGGVDIRRGHAVLTGAGCAIVELGLRIHHR